MKEKNPPHFFQEFGSLGGQSNSKSSPSGSLRVCSSLWEPLCAVGLKLSVLQEQQRGCIPAHSKGIHSTKSAWILFLSTVSTDLCFSMTYSGAGRAEPQPVPGSLVVFSVWAGSAFSADQLRHVYWNCWFLTPLEEAFKLLPVSLWLLHNQLSHLILQIPLITHENPVNMCCLSFTFRNLRKFSIVFLQWKNQQTVLCWKLDFHRTVP